VYLVFPNLSLPCSICQLEASGLRWIVQTSRSWWVRTTTFERCTEVVGQTGCAGSARRLHCAHIRSDEKASFCLPWAVFVPQRDCNVNFFCAVRTMDAAMGAVDKFFKITERGSTPLTEFRAGTVTFLTMCYILAGTTPHIRSTALPMRTQRTRTKRVHYRCFA